MKKIIGGTVIAAVLVLGGCSEQFTYEAEPVEDDNGGKNPEKVQCFKIEADSSMGGDDSDKQLGLFCKADK